MDFYNSLSFIIKICFGIILLIIIIYAFNRNRIKKINNRLSKYSLNNDYSVSLFDMIYDNSNNILKFNNKILRNIRIFDTYSIKYKEYTKDPMDFISIKIFSGLFISLLFVFTSLLNGNIIDLYNIVLCFLIGFFLLDLYYIIINKKNNKSLENDLLKSVSIMNNCFKSGYSIIQSIDTCINELDGKMKKEFEKISIDIKYGLSIKESFDRFYDRTHLDEIKYISSSLSIVNSTGGDIVKVFNTIEKNMINNKKIKDELNNLTQSAKFLSKVLSVLPIFIVISICLVDYKYFMYLFTNIIGYFIILIIIVLYILYILLVKKIIRVKE